MNLGLVLVIREWDIASYWFRWNPFSLSIAYMLPLFHLALFYAPVCQNTGNANGFLPEIPRLLQTCAAEEAPLSVQVLADVLSVLAVSCYSGFWRPAVKMIDILQGFQKPPVSYWLIPLKKHQTGIIDSICNGNCQWLLHVSTLFEKHLSHFYFPLTNNLLQFERCALYLFCLLQGSQAAKVPWNPSWRRKMAKQMPTAPRRTCSLLVWMEGELENILSSLFICDWVIFSLYMNC